MRKQLVLGSSTLVIGGLIYLFFRSSSLLMFSWIEHINMQWITDSRTYTSRYTDKLPEWFLYSLPDGLWVFSYTTLLLLIWNNKIQKQTIFWITSVPLTAICVEVLQTLHIVNGTFDWIDLSFYAIGFITPILLFTQKPIFKLK